MTTLITGVAGFIGSHLADALIERGHAVIGVDCFTAFYGRPQKEDNLTHLLGQPAFRLYEIDLSADMPGGLPRSIDYVIHLAGQPGVGASWGRGFSEYVRHNILATQHVLEAATAWSPKRVIVASSSSVYGAASGQPIREDVPLDPVSPYGVTKLAAEKLCLAYAKAFDLDIGILRYFSVYGPRQRPDMVFHRFFRAAMSGQKLPVHGDGTQRRDFTFVDDVVDATISALECAALPGPVNIGNGHPYDLRSCIRLIQEICGGTLDVEFSDRPIADPDSTWADIGRAGQYLGFVPRRSMAEGLLRQWEWMRANAERTTTTGP
jgi:UDP-glucuronate 4-epimerase